MRGLRWCVVTSLVLSACSDDPSSYEEGRAAVCGGACAAFRRCGLTDSGCESRCDASYDPHGIRGSALQQVGACLKSQTCVTLNDDTAFTICVEQAGRAEPLRDGLIAYCESASRAYFNCGQLWSVDACTDSRSVWEDAVLDAATQCHGADCDDLSDCEQAVFEDPP